MFNSAFEYKTELGGTIIAIFVILVSIYMIIIIRQFYRYVKAKCMGTYKIEELTTPTGDDKVSVTVDDEKRIK